MTEQKDPLYDILKEYLDDPTHSLTISIIMGEEKVEYKTSTPQSIMVTRSYPVYDTWWKRFKYRWQHRNK